jgi:hypothetical protein
VPVSFQQMGGVSCGMPRVTRGNPRNVFARRDPLSY